MKMRDMAMMMAGAMAVVAYQKYDDKIMKSVKDTLNQTTKSMDKSLDNMMKK